MRSPGLLPAAGSLVAGAVLVAGLTGCTDPDRRTPVPAPPPSASRGLDAASYYEDYRSAAGDDLSYAQSAPAPLASGARPASGLSIPEVTPPGPLEDNTFVDAGTSGFVDPSEDARSTFALDVDTGSWSVARTLLRQGLRPPPASIRVEEWVNALPAAAPESDTESARVGTESDTAAVGVSAESALAPSLDDGTQLVRVAVGTRPVRAADRRPVNLTLVVDRSGSMDIRERLGLVQSSLALLADSLRDDDTVSVVSFEDRARPLLDPTPVGDTAAILEAIERLTPGGSTNLEAGLRLGYRQARSSFREDATNLVVLASDGVANVGRTGPGSIVEQIRAEGAEGIHLVTVGYGMGNYNDHLMEQLADLGDGFYAYVDDYAEAERLFRDRLATALVPVAADARAQVTFDPDRVSSYRLVGYDNRGLADEDFADPAVDAGELGAGHHATALYEVRLVDGVPPGTPIGAATVQWNAVGSAETERAATELVSAGSQQPAGTFALEAVVADLAQLLKGGGPLADRGVTLADLGRRTAALEAAGVPGAGGVAELIGLAGRAHAGPTSPEDGPQPR